MGTPVPPVVSTGFGFDGGRNAIPQTVDPLTGAASYEAGFPPLTRTPLVEGGIPPSGLDMNGALYESSANIAWMTAGGQYAFSADVVTNQGGYNVGAIVQSASNPSKFFRNTLANNTNNPDSVITGWAPHTIDFPRTAGEIAASVTPVDTSWPPGTVLRYGVNTTPGTTDMTAAFQAAIDSMPALGGVVYAPSGDYAVTSIKQDGTSANKNYIRISGDGRGSVIRQLGSARATGVPGGDTTQSPNVIQAYVGTGFTLFGLRIIGNKNSGGVKPKEASKWVGSTLYTFSAPNTTYVRTRADGTAQGSGADLSTDKVWVLLATNTSNPTDIDPDVALGYWAAVINFAALNGYYFDESFNRGMCVYYGGPFGGAEVTDVAVESCRVESAYFANVLVGSGPALAPIVGAGVRSGRVANCYITDSSAGVGGLLRHDFEIIGNTITQATGNLINCDEDGSGQAITGNVLIGDTVSGARNGVSSFKSESISVVGNYIRYAQVGINFQDTGSASDRAGCITGNTVDDCGQVGSAGGGTGISCGGSDHTIVSGNHVRNPIFNGIKISDSAGCAVTGNTIFEAGAFGIDFEDCTYGVCSGNNVRNSGRDNFFFEGLRGGSVTGNMSIDGNTDDSASLYSGYRIGPVSATNSRDITVVGNYAADDRTPKRQHYGLNIETGTSGITVIANDFTTNKDGGVLNAGTNCGIGFNDVGTSAALVVESPFRPTTDGTLDLGSATFRWKSCYTSKVELDESIATPSAVTDSTALFAATDGEVKVLTSADTLKFVTGTASSTTAALIDAANSINTTNKYANKLVWNSTNTRMLRASGSAAADPWVSLDGLVSITPGTAAGNLQTAAGTGTVNNFALDAYCRFLDVTPTGNVTVTGFTAGVDNATFTITNLHATFTYSLSALNGGSSAANQIRGASLTLGQNDSVTLKYSSALTKWVVT